MKRNQIFWIFFWLAFALSAQETTLQTANAFYAKGDFEAAAQQYEMISQIQGESPELYYNLGNAYYRNGQLGKAILNYNRALLIAPHYDDARFNLRIAQQKVVDNVDVTSTFFLVQWVNDFGDLISSNQWAVLSLASFLLTLIMAFLYLFARFRSWRKISFNVAIFMLILSLISVSFAEKQSHKVMDSTAGIIMDKSVTAKDSPSLNAKDMFVLHEGTKVTIRDAISGWTEVELPDGNAGFIPSTSIEKI
jgi:tetratricopeptide (TPR) repeat protein